MLEIKICIGTSCYLKGAYNVLQFFQHEIETRGLHDNVSVTGSFCMGNCAHGVSVNLCGKIFGVSPENAGKFFEEEVLSRI